MSARWPKQRATPTFHLPRLPTLILTHTHTHTLILTLAPHLHPHPSLFTLTFTLTLHPSPFTLTLTLTLTLHPHTFTHHPPPFSLHPHPSPFTLHLLTFTINHRYMISWPLLQSLRPFLATCHEAYGSWAGDLRVAKCIQKYTGVNVEDVRGLHTEPAKHFLWADEATVTRNHGLADYASAEGPAMRPVTFHHLASEDLSDLDRAQVRGVGFGLRFGQG